MKYRLKKMPLCTCARRLLHFLEVGKNIEYTKYFR